MATDRRRIQDWLEAEYEWERCKGHHQWEAGIVLTGLSKCLRCGRIARVGDFRVHAAIQREEQA